MKALIVSGGGVMIYTLSDPRTNEIRYIGKTNNLIKRFNKHINESKLSTKSHKKAWINQLLKLNLKPIIEVIDIVPKNEWVFWETYWISQFRTWGFDLVNNTNGGEGVSIGNKPWNVGTKGVLKPNITTFKEGNKIGEVTRFKKGDRIGIKTEFKKGYKPPNSVLVNQYDLMGNLLKEFDSYSDAAKEINVTYSAIRNVILNKKFKCKGYLWKIKQ
jgi:hypothetical protein